MPYGAIDTGETSPSGHGYTLSPSMTPATVLSSPQLLAPALPSPPKRHVLPAHVRPVGASVPAFPLPPQPCAPHAPPRVPQHARSDVAAAVDDGEHGDDSDGDWDWVQFDQSHELGQPMRPCSAAPVCAPARPTEGTSGPPAHAPALAHAAVRATRAHTLSPVAEGSVAGTDRSCTPPLLLLLHGDAPVRPSVPQLASQDTITVRDFATPQAAPQTLPVSPWPSAAAVAPEAPEAPNDAGARKGSGLGLLGTRSVWDGGRAWDVPGLRLVLNIVVTCSEVEVPFPHSSSGTTTDGRRTEVWPIVGGRWDGVSPLGEPVGGTVVPGGADLPYVRPDGTEVVDAFYRLRADDGTTIILHNKGLVYPPESGEKYRLNPAFTAPAEGKYAFLNSHLFVASLVDVPPHLRRAREGENDRLIQVFCLF